MLGPKHPDTALSVFNLGVIAARRGRADEAFRLIDDALDRGLPGVSGKSLGETPELASLRSDPRFSALVVKADRLAGDRK